MTPARATDCRDPAGRRTSARLLAAHGPDLGDQGLAKLLIGLATRRPAEVQLAEGRELVHERLVRTQVAAIVGVHDHRHDELPADDLPRALDGLPPLAKHVALLPSSRLRGDDGNEQPYLA